MRASHIIYAITLSFLLSGSLTAQQFPIYSQYMLNGFLLNPAVAGHEGYTAVNLTVREQWLGLKDAPSTYAITGQTRLLKNSFISRSKSVRRRKRIMSRSGKVGLGGYIFNDQNGALSRMGFAGTYSYHLTLKRSQLSLGLSLQSFRYQIDKNKIRLEGGNENDELFQKIASRAFVADANFGAYYTDRYIYAGFSVYNLFESYFSLGEISEEKFPLSRQYITMAGYRFDVIDFLFLEPSFLFKFSENVVAQIDLNIKAYYKEDYWAGISFRSGGGNRIAQESINGRGSALIIMAGARVDKYYFGYAFDYTFSSISARTIGSHEIMLAAKFGDSARRYRWLNRY